MTPLSRIGRTLLVAFVLSAWLGLDGLHEHLNADKTIIAKNNQ